MCSGEFLQSSFDFVHFSSGCTRLDGPKQEDGGAIEVSRNFFPANDFFSVVE